MRLVITAHDAADSTLEEIHATIASFIAESGVFNTSAGTLYRHDRPDLDAYVYETRFNSRAWTGLS